LQNPDKLKVGQQLKIPSRGEEITKQTTNTAVEHTLSSDGTYTVVSGDSLSSIAKRFGVKTSDIIRANDMQNPDSIRIGQKLHIPNKTETKIVEKKSSENEPSAVAAAKSNPADSDKKSEKSNDKSSESNDDFFENFEKIPVVEISK
jgi:LysM repeat protein